MRSSTFDTRFVRSAAVVRRALALRHVLDGITAAAVAGALGASAAWALRAPWFALAGLSVVACGALYGAARAFQARWSDADVALFLDARIGGEEAVSTALEWRRRRSTGADAASASRADIERELTQRAEAALEWGAPSAIRPRITRRVHAVLPVFCAALLALAFVPPRAPAGAGSRDQDAVQAKLTGLSKVEPLRKAPGTEAEKQRLAALADVARQLAADVEKGESRTAALDALDKLRARTLDERKLVPDAARRPAIDAAARALARHPETAAAARALERTDLVALDQELERLANTEEARSREIAEQALAEAAAAARAKGSSDVAEILEEQQRLLKKRGADSAAMKELARLLGDHLPPEGARQLERLGRGDAEAAEALAQAMVDAMKGLSDEERKRVAEALQKSAQGMQGDQPMTAEQMKALAKALASEKGRADLQQALKEMASREPSVQAAQQAALSAALVGISEAQRQLSGSQPGSTPGSDPRPGEAKAQGGPSAHGGPGAHRGSTPEVAASSLPARAAGTALGGVPIGRAPGSSPGVARPPLEGLETAPGAARPRDVAPVQRSDVPREYRDQVGRYFAP